LTHCGLQSVAIAGDVDEDSAVVGERYLYEREQFEHLWVGTGHWAPTTGRAPPEQSTCPRARGDGDAFAS